MRRDGCVCKRSRNDEREVQAGLARVPTKQLLQNVEHRVSFAQNSTGRAAVLWVTTREGGDPVGSQGTHSAGQPFWGQPGSVQPLRTPLSQTGLWNPKEAVCTGLDL